MPPIPRYAPADIPPSYGEVFFFEYGVTVFWNFTSLQEAEILRSIKPFEQQPISESETQIENFWFQYDTLPNYQPRIYNDMITLKTGNHMVKLTISHALSQSVKLTLYEGKIDDSLDETKHLPRLLAARGDVKMSRRDITKLIGKLFKVRMSVNLVSNVLDIPELFWAEPSLEPLYHAIVSYLEIPQRVKTVNLRTEVISDLLDMLSSHMNSSKMDYLTWIIIILIAVDVVVLLLEIFVKAIKTQT
ncbi:hypothetical protein BKA69DRAFT_1031423 [Paraphysoderma sedebokerense]|nr:hypothetical protein BKA69DRAFT_1031423 [Paraphysoderma sedebokerense]